MRLTMVGTGDAFGSGGRAHTSMRLDANGACLVIDFGASALTAWKKAGLAAADIDAIVLSHLHGDHFGGLPFLLLDQQFVARRTRPLLIAGPPGLRARLEMAIEVFFPGSSGIHWSFPWQAIEITPGEPAHVASFRIDTVEVLHPSGAPSTGVRIEGYGRVVAYSGDTAWTERLVDLARGADIFVVECYSGDRAVSYHMDWPTLCARLADFDARRVVVTHMSDGALARAAEIAAAGCVVAYDGLTLDL